MVSQIKAKKDIRSVPLLTVTNGLHPALLRGLLDERCCYGMMWAYESVGKRLFYGDIIGDRSARIFCGRVLEV